MTGIDDKTEEELKCLESSGDKLLAKNAVEAAIEALNLYKKAHSLLCSIASKEIHALSDVKMSIKFKARQADFKPVFDRLLNKMQRAANAARILSMKR